MGYDANLFGVWNPVIPNVYHLGLTRPITGAFALSGELQCMFTARMLTDRLFKEQMQRSGPAMVVDKWAIKTNSTASMYSGQMSEMIGDVIGSRPSWRAVLSLCSYNPLMAASVYFYGPCNALRYRISGPFAVAGAGARYKEVCDQLGVFSQFIGPVLFDHVACRCMLSNFLLSTAAAFFKPTFYISVAMVTSCFVAPQRAVAEAVRTICQPTLSLVTAFSDSADPIYCLYSLMFGGTLFRNLMRNNAGALHITTLGDWLSANCFLPALALVSLAIGVEFFGIGPRILYYPNIFNHQARQREVPLQWFKDTYLNSQAK